MKYFRFLFYFLLFSFSQTFASGSIDLKFSEFISCYYSLETKEYCTDANDWTKQSGTVLISFTDDSLVTFILNQKSTYQFKANSIENIKLHGETVEITKGKNLKGETYILTIANDFFQLTKKGKWTSFFKKKYNDLSAYNFGSVTYNLISHYACQFSIISNDYTDSCSYENYQEVIPVTLKSRIKNEKLYITIQNVIPESQVIQVNEERNSDNQSLWIFTCLNQQEIFYLTIAPDYLNLLDNSSKVTFAEYAIQNNSEKSSVYTGSGVAIAPDILITNGHVIKELSSLGIYLEDKIIETEGFDIIGELSDEILDLAILKVKGAKLKACPISSEEPKLGTDILVYGYPQVEYQGTDLKVTKGIVSGKNGFKGDKSTFQFDAAIQPGNSGGPIVENGKIIGLATAYLPNAQNVNFAIKSSKIHHILKFYGIKPKANTNDFSECTYRLIGE